MLKQSDLPKSISQGLFPPVDGPAGTGPLMVRRVYNFADKATYQDEFTLQEMTGVMPLVQTIFIDNSQNTAALALTVGSLVTLRVPAKKQAILPFLCPAPFQFSLATTLADLDVQIGFINVPMPFAVWGATDDVTPDLTAIIALLTTIQTNTAVFVGSAYTDRSGTIAAGTVWQQLAPANAARKKLFLQANDANADVIYITFAAAQPADGVYTGAFKLIPGGEYSDLPPTTPERAWVTSPTIAQAFTAKEM